MSCSLYQTLKVPTMAVNANSPNSGLDGLAVNVHKLREACQIVFNVSFQLPRMTVTIDDDEIKSITGNREVVVLDDDFEDVGGALMPRNLELEDAEETQTFSQTSQSQPQSCQSWSWPQTQTDSFGDGADGAGVLSRASTGRSSKGRGRGRTARQQTSQSLQLQGLLAKPVHELAKMYIGERKKTERLESTKKQQLKEVLSLRRKCKRLEKDNKQLSQTLAVNNEWTIAKRGKGADGRGSRFTLTSWFAIGIRKCLSQVAAADFGLTTMVDVSGQTVMRCEKKHVPH